MATETNLVFTAASMAAALKDAFKAVDPDCVHRFDWADFGPYAPTEQGLAVAEALVALLAAGNAGEVLA